MSISNIAEGIGSQAAFKIDASTSLSMTFKRWVNCYIVTNINTTSTERADAQKTQ